MLVGAYGDDYQVYVGVGCELFGRAVGFGGVRQRVMSDGVFGGRFAAVADADELVFGGLFEEFQVGARCPAAGGEADEADADGGHDGI